MVPLSVCGVDGQITRDTWSTRTRKRCFQVWLYLRSTLTFTQWWKKRAKKEVEDENIAIAVRKWKMRRQSGGEKWLWMENPDRRIYKRQHDGFIWILHDLDTGGGPSRRTWSSWLSVSLIYRGRCSQQQRSQEQLVIQMRSLLQLQPPFSSSFISPNLIVNQNTVHFLQYTHKNTHD